MTASDRLVLKRQRHLKWRALDPLETALMLLCGLLLFGFCSTVIFDIVTREIGRPWLWLQEVTSTFFIYAIFVGAAVATRRNDHLYLTAIADSLHGTPRIVVEVGKPFEVIFENVDMMPHNFVLVEPGARQAVAEAVQTMKPDHLDKDGRAYIPWDGKKLP